MAMIKSVDALMLEHRGETNQDHSKTSVELKNYTTKEISQKHSNPISIP